MPTHSIYFTEVEERIIKEIQESNPLLSESIIIRTALNKYYLHWSEVEKYERMEVSGK